LTARRHFHAKVLRSGQEEEKQTVRRCSVLGQSRTQNENVSRHTYVYEYLVDMRWMCVFFRFDKFSLMKICWLVFISSFLSHSVSLSLSIILIHLTKWAHNAQIKSAGQQNVLIAYRLVYIFKNKFYAKLWNLQFFLLFSLFLHSANVFKNLV